MTDHYQTLGVAKNANDEEIKRAYRKLAMKHHPDRGGDQGEFQKIQEAYAVLSDPLKRQAYDNPRPQGGGFPPEFEDFFSRFNFNGANFSDVFGAQSRAPRNRTLNLQTVITLEDSFRGKELIANIVLPNGKEQIINVKIPPGINHNTMLRVHGVGDTSVAGAPPGDICLTVNVEPHREFQRNGDDLIKTVTINALDAILGTNATVTTLDERMLNVHIAPGTQHGSTLGLQGHGMPNVNDPRFRGRILLVVNIEIPTNLSEQQKELIRQARN